MDYSSDSDSLATSSTFDDSYYDPASELSYEFRQSVSYNYLADAQLAIPNHDEITIDNALVLNSRYRQLLEALRSKFEKMLENVKEKYAANEKLLEKLRATTGGKQISMRFSSVYICGAPYFKDDQLNPSPANADYLYRRHQLGEFFPIDVDGQTKHMWTPADKVDIILGIKEQVINFLKGQQGTSISEVRSKSKASRSTSKRIAVMREFSTELGTKPFVELFEMTRGSEFSIDWDRVSFKNLDSRHGPRECEAMWKHYLRPDLNHEAWTPEEEEVLLNDVITNSHQDWETIARPLMNRSALQCFVHYRTALSEAAQVKKNEKFDSFEDSQLMELVQKHSNGDVINWSKVCQQMPGRNRYQCYHRYMFTLKPGIKKARFTAEEDLRILTYVQMHGENFGNIPPNLLPGRTGVQIRNRYKNTLQHRGNDTWKPEEDEFLWNFVKENGSNQWSKLAKLLKTKNRFACRCRYQTILKHLERNPESTIRDVRTKTKMRSTPLTKDNFEKMVDNIQDPEEAAKKIESSMQARRRPSKETAMARVPKNVTVDDAALFHYLKYSFNWHYLPQQASFHFTEDEIERDYVLLQLLEFELYNLDFTRRFNCMSLREQGHLGLALQFQPSEELVQGIFMGKYKGASTEGTISIAPSWNTVLGYRGVQIMLSEAPTDATAPFFPVSPELTKYMKVFEQSLLLFKRRYVQMFYWTALLAKLPFKLVQEHWQMRCTTAMQIVDDLEFTKEEPFSHDVEPNQLLELKLVTVPPSMTVQEPEKEEEEDPEEEDEEEENAVDFMRSLIQEKQKEATTSDRVVVEVEIVDEQEEEFDTNEPKPSMPLT